MTHVKKIILSILLSSIYIIRSMAQTPACYDPLGAYQSPVNFYCNSSCNIPGVPAGSAYTSSLVCYVFQPPKYPNSTQAFTVTYSDVGTHDQNIKFYNTNPSAISMNFWQWYYLTEFHFHSPAEHTFTGTNGKAFQMEMHMVFRPQPSTSNTDPGIVVAVPITVGTNPTPFDGYLSSLLSGNLTNGQTTTISTALFTSCLNTNNAWNFPPFITYPGSLTTSPYSEGYTWLVIDGFIAQPVVISQATLNLFTAIKIGSSGIGASRAVQKNYSRQVLTMLPPAQ